MTFYPGRIKEISKEQTIFRVLLERYCFWYIGEEYENREIPTFEFRSSTMELLGTLA